MKKIIIYKTDNTTLYLPADNKSIERESYFALFSFIDEELNYYDDLSEIEFPAAYKYYKKAKDVTLPLSERQIAAKIFIWSRKDFEYERIEESFMFEPGEKIT